MDLVRTAEDASNLFDQALAKIEGPSLRAWAESHRDCWVTYARHIKASELDPVLKLTIRILCEGLGL